MMNIRHLNHGRTSTIALNLWKQGLFQSKAVCSPGWIGPGLLLDINCAMLSTTLRRCNSPRSRNNLTREKTKAIRSNVLEVIYGGKESIPRDVNWGRKDASVSLDDFSDDEVGGSSANSVSVLQVKQRAFLKESGEYQKSSLDYINLLQKEDTTPENCLKELQRHLSVSGEMPESDIIQTIHYLCMLPEEERSVVRKSLEASQFGNELCKAMPTMTTEEFVKSLLAFLWFEIPLSPNHNTIIETESLRRMSSWDINTLCLVADWWICKSGATSWAFHEEFISLLREKWTRLSAHQTVHAFYLCGQFKRTANELVEKLTLLAERLVDDLSLTETAAICNGFIKVGGRLPNKSILPSVISSSLSKSLQLQTDLDLYNVVTVLRFLGRSYHYDDDLYSKVAEKLVPHIPRMESLALPHVAAVYARAQLANEPLFNEIIRCFNHSKAILKDYYLILWSLCKLNYSSVDFEKFVDMAVVRIVEEEVWTQKNPFIFVKTLVPLTYIGVYPKDLLARAFSQAYLRSYKRTCPVDVYKHLYCLDSSLSIECPDSTDLRLPKDIARQSDLVPHGSKHVLKDKRREYGQIIDLLSEVVGGQDYLLVHAILDHIRTPFDIEVHLDASRLPVNLQSQPRNGTSHKKLAVLIGPEYHYRRKEHSLLGVHVMKRRQLKMAGYEIVEIPFFEWNSIKKLSKAKKIEYLSEKLFQR